MEQEQKNSADLMTDLPHDFVAGSVAGAASMIPSHPLDLVKVRQQTLKLKGAGITSFCEIAKKEEFIKGLYKGMSFPIVGQAIINSIVFMTQGFTEKLLKKSKMKDAGAQFLSGGFGGAVQSLVCSPMELVKIQMQLKDVGVVRSADYRRSTMEFKNIKRQGGIMWGVYRGFWITTVRDTTGFAFYFCSYHTIRVQVLNTFYQEEKESGEMTIEKLPWQILGLAGGTAGCISWAVNYPVDVFKTLIQEDALKEMLAKEKGELYHKEYTGAYDCAKKVLARDGIKGYYRGMIFSLIRAFANSAVLLPIHTTLFNYLKN
ncbi:PREDICTED: mitochondrial basic amino acids transporter-like [Amphimedon queenslandica]|uniref:Mitochondrial carrier protein n=1 Tax=Amphimedon queenslandica TaxID=400682 RepID=A0A1X7TD87_AMPQE|nr:PREDICTED: mitochondrial basic amino acids transporter-like [Amphimedon queenslandica]|eukprot:XP_011407770.1 PREDICTED: mitochondrial basic amino acids transporter-like [Amphimedon queenslandica]